MNTVCDRDWPEDFEHENGEYMNTCCECKNTFTGHKRRFICKACSTSQGGEAVEVFAYGSSDGYQPVSPRHSIGSNGERMSYYDIPLMTVAQHQRILAAAYQPSSVVPVRVTGSLDEIDAQTWPFINEEARKVGAEKGSIEAYQYERANGGVVVLWDRPRVHAMAVTIRDDLNRTRCIRMLADTRPADQVADDLTMVKVSRELLEQIAVELEHDNDRYFLGRELRALLAAASPQQPLTPIKPQSTVPA